VQESLAPELPTLEEDITAIQVEADTAIQVTPVQVTPVQVTPIVESAAESEFDLSAFVLTQDAPTVAATSNTTTKKTRKTSKTKAAEAVEAPKPARRKTAKVNAAIEVAAVETDVETATEAPTAVELASEVQLAQPATTQITRRKKTTAKTQSLNGFSAIMAAYADTVLDEPEANAPVVNKTKAKATSKTIAKTSEPAATESAEVTAAEPKSNATKSKSKVTRMADWANDAAAVTEPVNEKPEATVVPITEAKSARRKNAKPTGKTRV
jgi:hypothetical protein